MAHLDILSKLATRTDSKIVLLVMDGVGSIHTSECPRTELELARIPNLNRLAKEGCCGRSMPVSYAITPGSGPGHLSLFGYDPLEPAYDIGRGVLEALGIDFKLEKSDIAARGNFCDVNAEGVITNRRAGRLPTDECIKLCKELQDSLPEMDGVKVFIMPVKEYRFALVLRGAGLSPAIADTDPQKEGFTPKDIEATEDTPAAQRTVAILKKIAALYYKILKPRKTANSILLRGFSSHPGMPTFQELYKLTPAAIATYPLYRGVATLAGMDILKTGTEIADEFKTLEENWAKYDFFFIHIKKTDSYGEDGNSTGRIKVIEETDGQIPRLLALKPDVIAVTGDHSTPPPMKAHSWHPVPFLLRGKFCDADDVEAFNEGACNHGRLGMFPARAIMEMLLACAGKLQKYGA
jgi:2,3-bisphosphoglycerate-independent phosphoglycerate mutase